MALQFEVESLEGLEESVTGLYVEHDGKYRLDVSGIDPADELKTALNKERSETKKFKEKATALEKAQADAEKARATEKGEFKTLYESTQAELENERMANREFKQKIQSRDIDNSSLMLASELTRDNKRAELLKKEISQFSRFTDEGIKFELGGIEVDKSKVINHLTENYPFLVDGNQASGGGASGGQGSGAAKTMSRADFDNLKQSERKKFTVSGGKVI